MSKKLWFIFMLVILTSCQSTSQFARRDRSAGQYYMTSGVEKFYLSEVPHWANFSESGQCQRSQAVRFVEIGNLMKSQNLDYSSAIQFQYLVNKQRAEKKAAYNSNYLIQKDEEIIFYDSLDKINNNIRPFVPPKFSSVHLVWIDSYLKEKHGMDKLDKLMKSKKMEQGHPVFVSLCFDRNMIKKMIESNRAYPSSIKIMPVEMTSVFNEKGESTYQYSINFDHYFRKSQKLFLFVNETPDTRKFKGNFKIIK